jgi:hypothetical protein|tara:strand:- start:317 stop:745 length:429 start_codon:yes stop_codon:yes gene_type:complete
LKPPAVLKVIVEIHEKWGSRFQLLHAGCRGEFGIGNVMKNPERVPKVATLVRKSEFAEVLKVKLHVGLPSKSLPGYPERCLARIDAVEYPYPRRKESRPTPRTATCIKADRIISEFFPREDRRVEVKHLLQLGISKGLIGEA